MKTTTTYLLQTSALIANPVLNVTNAFVISKMIFILNLKVNYIVKDVLIVYIVLFVLGVISL